MIGFIVICMLVFIAMNFNKVRKLGCLFGMHVWAYKGLKRTCKDCQKREVWIQSGPKSNDGFWK